MKIIPANAFTKRQLSTPRAVKLGDILHDYRTLRKLSIIGLVRLHEHTKQVVRHVWEFNIKVSYIDSAESFKVDGVGVFHQQYFHGCFNPYLIRAEKDE